MLDSDHQQELMDALRSASRSIQAVALQARSAASASVARDLKGRADDLKAHLGSLGPSQSWSGNLNELLGRASDADEELTEAREALSASQDPEAAYRRALAAAEAAIEVAAELGADEADEARRSK